MSCLFLLLVFVKIAEGCHTFNSTQMVVRLMTGEYVRTSVTGCIERKAFGNVKVTQIEVKDQKIPHLRRDDVRHLVHLMSISFESCQIWDIEPALFRNVPYLRSVKIAFNDFIEVKQGIFSSLPSLEVLLLNNNNIGVIEDGAFGNVSSLKEVRCDHNRLEEWREEWFNNSTNIEVIDFRFNRIKVMRSLTNFKKLKELLFDYNELELIQPDAFKGLKKLNYIGLRYNRLTLIDSRIFPWDFTIDVLSIGSNYLNYIPRRLLAKITVREMEVQGNPWKCPCLDQIFHWLYETNGTVTKQDSCAGREIPACCYSSLYPYTCVEKEDEEATEYFLMKLREYDPPLVKYCARLN